MKLKHILLSTLIAFSMNVVVAQTKIYVNSSTGNDSNNGTKESPLKTLSYAAKKVNESTGTEGVTIFLASGVYAVNEPAVLQPTKRTFTKENRLTIRAEILPDDPNWNTGSMPTFIHTMPLTDDWMGQKDPFGGCMYGIKVETSHVSLLGLKILGAPVIEHPEKGRIVRVYPVTRTNPALEDLEVSQCVFAGDEVNSPLHLGIIANGNSIVIDHCIFYGLKQAVVYWSGKSTGHVMRNTLIYNGYGCGVWTSAIANDFVFENNIIANSNYSWISQLSRDSNQQVLKDTTKKETAVVPILYQVNNSLFAGNKKITGTGGGPQLNFKDIDPILLKFNNTKITEQRIELDYDQESKNFLHPVKGTLGADIGVGLFKTPMIEKQLIEIKPTAPSKDKSSRLSQPNLASGKFGNTTLTIDYSSPLVKDRKIWGELVPYEKVWRAGANEATTITTDGELTIAEKKIPAGKYTFYVIPTEKEWTIIVNSQTGQWGIKRSGETTRLPENDVLTATIIPKKSSVFNEKLLYEVTKNGFILKWENLELPVSVK